MVICMIAAGIISILSIFSFFGGVFDVINIPSMFDLMFGATKTVNGTVYTFPQYGGFTFLFVLQILIIVISFVGFWVAYKVKKVDFTDGAGIGVSIVSSLMSLVALIISFCTFPIIGFDPSTQSVDVKLGFGPVFYSILHIIVILLFVAGMLINRKSLNDYDKKYIKTTNTSSSFNTWSSKPSLSESEKADLILKYKKMFDEGVITKEEYDKKKNELV